MSGKTKRIIYIIFNLVLWLAAIGGLFLMLRFGIPKEKPEAGEFLACGMLVLAIILRIPVLIHELGHLVFGWFSGFKVQAVSLGLVRITRSGVSFNGYSSVAGATEMLPRSGKNMRARFFILTLGGALFNFIVGGALLALYLCLPYHEAFLFCGMLALFSVYEGLRALFPVRLPAGKTDGAVAVGLIKKAPEEEIALRVLKAQGVLVCGKFSDLSRDLLFQTPVVREDDPAFIALLFLRMQFLLYHGEEIAANEVLARLEDLGEYMSDGQRETIVRYGDYFKGQFSAKKEPLLGVRDLEEKLESNSIKE